MAIVTLEDLQGIVEVVVFPRTWEETAATWTEGAILLVAGRIDHRGDEVSLLADLVVEWEPAMAARPGGVRPPGGPGGSFARALRAGRQRQRPRWRLHERASGFRRSAGGCGRTRAAADDPRRLAGRVSRRATAPAGPVSPLRSGAISPLRGGGAGQGSPPGSASGVVEGAIGAGAGEAVLPRIVPAEPVPTDLEPEDLATLGPDDDEPPLPDEASALVAEAAAAPTAPLEAGADQVLHVRFSGGTGTEGAMEAFRQLIRARPGATRVVIHVPGGRSGVALPMELRTGVAYDAELLAEVRSSARTQRGRAQPGLTEPEPTGRFQRPMPSARIAWTTE